MIQTSEGNLPQGLDTAIHTGLERGRRTVARRARVRRGAVRSALCLALVLGLFAGVYVNNGISLLAYFAGIVPHGIFELPALILALSSGIYLCRKVTDYVRHNEKGVMGPLMKDLLRLFVMHIIPLLMAAAVIEAYVTPQLLKLFL